MNHVILTGRLAADPELRHTNNDKAVCSFRLAVNRRYNKDKEKQEADFISCVAWEGRGEFIAKYFKKGDGLDIVGRLSTRMYESEDGKKHYITEVVVSEAEFPNGKKGEGKQNNSNVDLGTESDGFYPSEDDDELPF